MVEDFPQNPGSTAFSQQSKIHRRFGSGSIKKKFALVGALIVLAIAIPATIFLSQQQQDIRQRASETGACGVAAVDVVLVIDTSNSMQGGKLTQAKNGATAFVNKVLSNGNTKNRVGIASFDNNGGLNLVPTSNRATVLSVINGLKTPGSGKNGTCLECALDKKSGGDVLSGFANISNEGNERHVIILTDGKINRWQKPNGSIEGSQTNADEKKSRDQAAGALNRIAAANPNLSVSVMQYGGTANKDWIQSIIRGKGTYQGEGVNGASIESMFLNIATKLMGGTIEAYVFTDTNNNGNPDAGETPLANVTVKLAEGSKSEEKRTNGEGKAIFTGVCTDKQYTVTTVPPTGFEGSPNAAALMKTISKVAEGQTVKVNFGLKKVINATSLTCSPTEIVVNGKNQTITATLKDKDGKPIANKPIAWTKESNDIQFVSTTARQLPAPEEDTTFFAQVASSLVQPVQAACSGNRDCRGGTEFCVNKKCVECRNPGSKNDCNNKNKVCNNNHKCVLPTPTLTPTPTRAPTATPTKPPVTATPGASPTATTAPTAAPTAIPEGTIVTTTNASGIATIIFTLSDPQSGEFTSNVKATFDAEGVYTTAVCSAQTTYTPPVPEVTLEANPDTIQEGQKTTLTWKTKNVTECTASQGWNGAKSAKGGSEETGPISENTGFTLTCSGPGGTVEAFTEVSVQPKEPSLNTVLHLEVLLHGIGASGDNVLPLPTPCQRSASQSASKGCLSNQNPLHPDRDLKVEIFDQNNKLVKTVDVQMSYDQTLGGFKTTVPLGKDWTSGVYDIQVYSPKYLSDYLTQNFTINKGTTVPVPVFDLISSDVNLDDKIDILDWNIIAKCYAFPGMQSICSAEEILKADTDDDNDVDDFDLNLFRRDLSSRSGPRNR